MNYFEINVSWKMIDWYVEKLWKKKELTIKDSCKAVWRPKPRFASEESMHTATRSPFMWPNICSDKELLLPQAYHHQWSHYESSLLHVCTHSHVHEHIQIHKLIYSYTHTHSYEQYNLHLHSQEDFLVPNYQT